jgi:glucose-1-phosphate adenylyltransferase
MDMLRMIPSSICSTPVAHLRANPTATPHNAGEHALISHSLVTEGCEIYGSVEYSVLFNSVTIAPPRPCVTRS